MSHEWTDSRIHIWVLPLSAIVIFGYTLVVLVSLHSIYLENFGGELNRKISLIAILLVALLIGVYGCIGLYQIFVNEIYRLFIVRKAECYGDKLELRGYYFKKDTFDLSLVKSVESFSVQKWRRFKIPWKNMMTLFNYEKSDSNYKVMLKDGRIFYLPGDINDVEDLKLLLESFAQADG